LLQRVCLPLQNLCLKSAISTLMHAQRETDEQGQSSWLFLMPSASVQSCVMMISTHAKDLILFGMPGPLMSCKKDVCKSLHALCRNTCACSLQRHLSIVDTKEEAIQIYKRVAIKIGHVDAEHFCTENPYKDQFLDLHQVCLNDRPLLYGMKPCHTLPWYAMQN